MASQVSSSSSLQQSVPLSSPGSPSLRQLRRSREEGDEQNADFIERAAKRVKLDLPSSTNIATNSPPSVPEAVRQEFERVQENMLQMLEQAREDITQNLSRKEESSKTAARNSPSVENIEAALRGLIELKNATQGSRFFHQPSLDEIKKQVVILLDLFKNSNELHAQQKKQYTCYLNEIINLKSSRNANQNELADLLELCNYSLNVEFSAEGFLNKLEVLKQLNKKEEEYQCAVTALSSCFDVLLLSKLAAFFQKIDKFELSLQAYTQIIDAGSKDPEILRKAILAMEDYFLQLPDVSTIQSMTERNKEVARRERLISIAKQYDKIRIEVLTKEFAATPIRSLMKYTPEFTWNKLTSIFQIRQANDQEAKGVGGPRKNLWETFRHHALPLEGIQSQNAHSATFTPHHPYFNSGADFGTPKGNSQHTASIDAIKRCYANYNAAHCWQCAHSTDLPTSSFGRNPHRMSSPHYSPQTPPDSPNRDSASSSEAYQINSGPFASPYPYSLSAANLRASGGNSQPNLLTRNPRVVLGPPDSTTVPQLDSFPDLPAYRSTRYNARLAYPATRTPPPQPHMDMISSAELPPAPLPSFSLISQQPGENSVQSDSHPTSSGEGGPFMPTWNSEPHSGPSPR
jgi:hypothetical protein